MRNRYSVIIFICFIFFYGTIFCLAGHVSAAVKIVAFGDSITAGVYYLLNSGEGCRCPEEGYEVQLEEQMDFAGYRLLEVYNYGVPGERTSAGSLRIDGVLDIENPDYVLLLEGTNDLSNTDPSTPYTVTDNLSDMVEKVLDSGATPILATLTPATSPTGSLKNITGTNELIRSLWDQKVQDDKKVLFADLYAAVVGNWDNLSDDDLLHPNQAGYGVIAETWGAVLQQDLINIDLAISGQGTVSSDQQEEDCTSCRVTLPLETEITLTATPADGSIFTGWSGECADRGQTPECVLTADDNMSITAMFTTPIYWQILPAILSNRVDK